MSTPVLVQSPLILRGVVKQVLSGDSVIIRGQPKGGPPPERQINFSNVSAPRLARRPGGNVKGEDSKDEPWAWEAREFLRKKLVGKDVLFVVDYKVPNSGREYGTVYLGKELETAENMTESILNEGLVSIRKEKADLTRLIEIEEAAKIAQKGKWGPNNEDHVRNVTWQIENPRAFIDKMGRKPIQAIVEHVRDGSTVRVFLLPSFNYITLMVSGIRAPGFKLGTEGKPDSSSNEPLAEEAKYFTEMKLLQQDIQIILESVNNNNFVGTILHPNGNIAEVLLKEGFAKCIDWSMGFVTGGAEKLRAAEKSAKEKKMRIWRDFQASASNNSMPQGKEKDFIATVYEVINADALNVKKSDGTIMKIFLASIRPPRAEDSKEKKEIEPAQSAQPKGKGKDDPKKIFRPLYDVPFMFEAREYLRKKLIGKKVQVTVDYRQPAQEKFPEKFCCTVKCEGVNVGEALISKGLAKVVRYRQDDDQRASDYDALLAAEAKAEKSLKGVHGKKDVPMLHVVDITGDKTKAQSFLPFFQRAGKTTAVVEFVASGSRLRLFVPRETRIITFLLAGINCPRAGRPPQRDQPGMEGEPYGEEALTLTKDLCLQREVEIEVDSIDKAGNFIGWLWVGNKNLSVMLVEESLASVHFSAEKSHYFRQLQIAEDNGKKNKEKIWLNYEEVSKEDVKVEDERAERKVELKSVIITEVTPELHVFVQFTEEGDKLETLTNDFRRELADHPPLTGAYTPKLGDLCVARYSADNEWYRARVEKVCGGEANVLFVDYGNRETVKTAKCAQLPPAFTHPDFAREFALAFLNLPSDEEYAADSLSTLRHDVSEGKFLMNIEYKSAGIDYITLVTEGDNKIDIGQSLVKEGLFLVENRKDKRLQKLMKDYKAAEKEAKQNHHGVWRYGDITEDDAREFGAR